jgi:acyl-CoA thioesterase II
MDEPSAPGDLERDTRVTRAGESGAYTAAVSPDWQIWGPNGGYMATIALRAGMAEAKIQNPASIYVQFLRAARTDVLDVRVAVVQSGRRAEAIRVSMTQDGKPVLEALLRTALPNDGLVHRAVDMPEVAPPESLPLLDELLLTRAVPRFSFWNNIEARVLQPRRFETDVAPVRPHMLEWYRFRPRATFDDPVLDAARGLILVDTLGWPSAWLAHPGTKIRAPNLDIAVFFHQSAQNSEWLLCEQLCQVGAGGLLGASGRVFDREGRLIASGGGQLLCMPGPDA